MINSQYSIWLFFNQKFHLRNRIHVPRRLVVGTFKNFIHTNRFSKSPANGKDLRIHFLHEQSPNRESHLAPYHLLNLKMNMNDLPHPPILLREIGVITDKPTIRVILSCTRLSSYLVSNL